MTREEAIQILSTRDAHGVLCGYTSGVTEALDMAIEALSPSGELIRRADAIEAIQAAYCEPCKERGDDYCGVRCRACDFDCAMMQIDALSTDAVKGEWVIRENGNKECSLCGHEKQDGWDYFCGYCGARMKGGDTE